MKRFKLAKSSADIVSHAGLALVGRAIHHYTSLASTVDRSLKLRHGIAHSDILKTYVGLLCLGKNDFESVNTIESSHFFSTAFDINRIPSEATLRQRMNENAKPFSEIIDQANIDLLVNAKPTLTPLAAGYVPLDVDVTPMDNSRTKKEGVSRTYKKVDGYAPIAAYLGQEGYCLGLELREGKQHCQKDTPEFLTRVLAKAARVTDQPLLLRLDSGNDSIENIDLILNANQAGQNTQRAPTKFIIKWNPRKEDAQEWLNTAELQNCWKYPRKGKRVAVFERISQRQWRGREYSLSRVIRVVERTIDKHGQGLIEPEIELEGWWNNLDLACDDIIQLYADHGTSEQFHSEFKTDLDIERLPSGKFSTNALILAASTLAYNILRLLGQNGLVGAASPIRHNAARRRIKTVIQELMYVAVRVVKSAGSVILQFGKGCRVFDIFGDLYQKT